MREDDDPRCKRCGDGYSLRRDCEPSDYCDNCAQELLVILLAACKTLWSLKDADQKGARKLYKAWQGIQDAIIDAKGFDA